MKISDIVEDTIKRFSTGYVFTYSDFKVDVKYNDTVRKHLSRMATTGRIVRLSRGKYYKVEISSFGNVPVARFQMVKDLLEQNGKPLGYITGFMVYNELGLTTQVPNTIQIGTNEVKKPLKREMYRVSFILQKNAITKANIPLLKILDAIKYIKKIPDTTVDTSVVILCRLLKKISKNELKNIIKLAMKYPPSTRAILGAMIESIYSSIEATLLKESMNGISRYYINISEKTLPTKHNWNIK